MNLRALDYKRAVLVAGAVGVVGAFAYVYVKRSASRRKTKKNMSADGLEMSLEHDLKPDEFFEDAVAYVSKHGDNLPNQAKLQLYGLFKQATVGPCNTSKPSLIDQVGRAKWDAWAKFAEMPSELAKLLYLEVTASLFPEFAGDDGDGSSEPNPTSAARTKGPSGGGGFGPVFSSMVADEGYGDEDDGSEAPGTHVHQLAKNGELTSLQEAVASGVDVNVKDEEGRTPLHWAADSGHSNVVEWLLENGASVNDQDIEGQSALHYAALCERVELCRTLLLAGADAQLADVNGETPQDLYLEEWSLP